MGISRRAMLRTLAAGALLPELLDGSKQVWGQVAGSTGRKALGLTIGLNGVDPNFYGGWDGRLTGCVPDSLAYQRLLTAKFQATSKLSWDVFHLETQQATIAGVAQAILWAAKILGPGDLFVVAYAGHGGQLPDTSGDEQDSKDETWCLFNGQVRDDELYRFWTCFAEGVRIVVISDSCHSGTAARIIQGASEIEKDLNNGDSQLSKRVREIAGPTADSAIEGIKARAATLRAKSAEDINARSADNENRAVLAMFREMPPAFYESSYIAKRSYYDQIAATLPKTKSQTRGEVKASVLTLGASQDEQTSIEINGHGLFTSVFEKMFDNASSYRNLHSIIRAEMPPSQQPNFDPFGTNNPSFLDNERPFSV